MTVAAKNINLNPEHLDTGQEAILSTLHSRRGNCHLIRAHEKIRELIFSRQNDKLKFSTSGETCGQTTVFSAQTILRLECEEQPSRFF